MASSRTLLARCLKVFGFFALIIIPFVFIFFMIQNDSYITGKSGPREHYKPNLRRYKQSLQYIDNQTRILNKLITQKKIQLQQLKKNGTLKGNVSFVEKQIKAAGAEIKSLKKNKNYTKLDFVKYSKKVEKNKYGYLRYLMGLMTLYWITNLIPIAPVGLFPLTMAPLMRLLTVDDVIKSYMTDANMMILCGSIMSLGAASAGLSKRVGFLIMSLCGANRRLTAVCVMLICLLFSMWWVNTAVMIFMCRAIDDIIQELKEGVSYGTLGDARRAEWNEVNTHLAEAKARKRADKASSKKHDHSTADSTPAALSPKHSISDEFINPLAGGSTFIVEKDMKVIRTGPDNDTHFVELSHTPSITVSMRSATSYGSVAQKRHEAMKHENKAILEEYRMILHHCAGVFCSIGGLYWTYNATTNPHLFHKKSSLKGLLTVSDWMNWTFPIIVMTSPFLIFCMDLAHFGPDYLDSVLRFIRIKKTHNVEYNVEVSPQTAQNILAIFQDKYNRLGPMSVQEKGCLVIKVLSIIALLVRMSEAPWGWIFDNSYTNCIKRSVTISDSTVLAFAIIVGFVVPKNIIAFCKGPLTLKDKPVFASTFGWKTVQDHFPWGILLIVGGSTAIAEAFETNGLAGLEIARFNSYLQTCSKEGVLLICILYTMVLSNALGSTCAAIVVARYLGQVGGCYFAVPCVAATAFAFLFPVGTSTMAVASIKLDGINSWYCLKKGILPSVVCTFIVYLFGLFYTEQIIQCISVKGIKTCK